MAAENCSQFYEAYPMSGGDGPNSYAKNSTYQRGVVDAAKELLNKAIAEKLDMDILLSSNTFNIADLGCSVGPNTFFAVENILEAVELKYQSQGLNSQIPEFQVFFNDHKTNDFNLLFKSLPQNRRYYAVGVPGSFYGRLFPNASVQFFHSSYTIHWLSRVPKVVVDKNCASWNAGQIHYSNSTDEVVRAYEAQYAKDMECFLHARAQEIVLGGLMVLITPGRPHGIPHSHSSASMTYQLLGSCLTDMARKGVVSEEKVDSFSIPMYYMSPQELEACVERNGCFSIKIMENLPHVVAFDTVAKSTQLIASHVRAAMEGLIKLHFGEEILDELFCLYRRKLEEQPTNVESGQAINFLVVLKRKRRAVNATKVLINKEIAEKLDIEILLSSNTFHIADLGCSVGPNTFFAVENVLEAVEFKYRSQGLNSHIPEFQVFFNDNTINDFNMLFKSLPPNRRYYAVGVPGSFYGRIFPNASIHFFHSSITIHWLSRVPKEVVDKNSPAWNKGRIHYSNSTDEVVRAYEAQYAEDMGCFLHARAQEIVFGGLMVLIIPCRPNGIPHSHSPANVTVQLLGSCLMDLARKGVVPEEKVDSFNIPMYYMSPQEMEGAVEQNGCFSVEGMKILTHVKIDDTASETLVFVSHMRAVLEGLLKHQFGEEILNELFDLYHKKLEEHPYIFESEQAVQFIVVLRRKAN